MGCENFCCTSITGLSVSFGDKKALDNINLHMHCGEITAITGKNGAGKTTLYKAILGEIPFSGLIEFKNESGDIVKPVIGYVPQKLPIDSDSPMSVKDLFMCANTQLPVCIKYSKNVMEGMKAILSKVEAVHLIDKMLCKLSGGELQRVLIGLSLLPLPNILLMDEPVSGMDEEGTNIFWELIDHIRKENDLMVAVISHSIDHVKKYAQRIVRLNNGRAEVSVL